MPIGKLEYYTFRGQDKLSEDTLALGELDKYRVRTVRRFHTERPSAKDNTFLIKYAISPTEGGTAGFWYHHTFTQDAPIESIVSTLNAPAAVTTRNLEAGEFNFSFLLPTCTNKLIAEVTHVGQTITFKATRGLAYKMGLIPDKEYTVSDTEDQVIIGDYNIHSIDSQYYDLFLNGKHVARDFPDKTFDSNVLYNVYMANDGALDNFIVRDNNNRELDVAYSIEMGYIISDVNFRLPRFNDFSLPGPTHTGPGPTHIHTGDYKEAGFKEINVFDRDHFVSENNRTVTYVGYEIIPKTALGVTPYITNNFELTRTEGEAMVDTNLGTLQANVVYFIIVGADVVGKDHSNLTVLPLDASKNIIPVTKSKTFTNPLVTQVAKPKIEIAGVSTNVPGVAPLVVVSSTVINKGYTSSALFQNLYVDTPISFVNQTTPTTMTNSDTNNKFLLIGSQALCHYLDDFPQCRERFSFFSGCEPITTTSFNTLSHNYVFTQVNVNDTYPLYYRISYLGTNRYVNEDSINDGILWIENIPDYFDVTCTAINARGEMIYEVPDFSFELTLR